jgi:hypothetical protein
MGCPKTNGRKAGFGPSTQEKRLEKSTLIIQEGKPERLFGEGWELDFVTIRKRGLRRGGLQRDAKMRRGGAGNQTTHGGIGIDFEKKLGTRSFAPRGKTLDKQCFAWDLQKMDFENAAG